MNRVLRTAVLNTNIQNIFNESKRLAGHNKWSNIKHTKQEIDAQKQRMIFDVLKQMKNAINAKGGETDPAQNSKLAKILEYAKKNNIPQLTLENTLKRAKESKRDYPMVCFNVHGPNNCALVVKTFPKSIMHMRMTVTSKLKKTPFKIIDSHVSQLFENYGIITTKADRPLDKAMEDAIIVEAEDVEECEVNNEKQFKFRCSAININKIKTKLETQQYSVLLTEDVYEPTVWAELKEEEVKVVETIRNKLLEVDEVETVIDNITGITR